MASQGALDEDALRRRLPRWLVRMLLVALLATAGVEALWRAGALTQAEWFMGDVWWSLHGVRTRAEAPVVLATTRRP